MSFSDSNTYKAIKSSGVFALTVWLFAILSFFISFGFAQFNSTWGQVGWIVPLGVLGSGLFIFACIFDFCLYVAYREFVRKDKSVSLKILSFLDKYLNNKFIAFLCITCFVITAIPAIYYILPMIPVVLVICFLFRLYKEKNNKK